MEIAEYKKLMAKPNNKTKDKAFNFFVDCLKEKGFTWVDKVVDNYCFRNMEYTFEFKFSKERKFRSDIALSYKRKTILVEYNGIFSAKSRHTSIVGYSKDLEKINLAQIMGYVILQYTPLNYSMFKQDLEKLLA